MCTYPCCCCCCDGGGDGGGDGDDGGDGGGGGGDGGGGRGGGGGNGGGGGLEWIHCLRRGEKVNLSKCRALRKGKCAHYLVNGVYRNKFSLG